MLVRLYMFFQKKSAQKTPPKDPILAKNKEFEEGMETVRSFIAPSAMEFASNYVQVGEAFSRTLVVTAYPKYLSTGWFSPIINIDYSMDISMFMSPMETTEVLKSLRDTAAQLTSQIRIEEEKGMVRDPIKESAIQNVESLRTGLQEGTERFFRFGLYITLYGKTKEELDESTRQLEAMLEAQMVYVKPTVLRMSQGFSSTLPLGNDELNLCNNLNTEPLSTTFPFISSELSSNEGILYGINRHNNSLVLFDRFNLENANMVIFAKSGAGKSYAVKLEVLRSMMLGANVCIIDPENEYKHLCETVGGSFVSISLNSRSHLNPFDLPKLGSDSDPADVFRSHIAGLIGLMHLMLGRVTPEEDTILDRALRETYAIRDITPDSNLRAIGPEQVPTVNDLAAVLENISGAESLSARLEKYTQGVFSGFLSHPTNVNFDNQMVVFNIRDLEDELRPIAMYVILQIIWNEMRSELKKRLLVVDEAWVMMQNEDAASFLYGIAKRCRKYYTGLTTITQDISDFMASRYGKPIVSNSSMQLLLKQSPSSIDTVVDTFYLTDQEKFLLLECNVGEGIFFAGAKHVALKVIASYSEDQIITSDPRQLLEIEEAKRELG